jgi:hypothetical protein
VCSSNRNPSHGIDGVPLAEAHQISGKNRLPLSWSPDLATGWLALVPCPHSLANSLSLFSDTLTIAGCLPGTSSSGRSPLIWQGLCSTVPGLPTGACCLAGAGAGIQSVAPRQALLAVHRRLPVRGTGMALMPPILLLLLN